MKLKYATLPFLIAALSGCNFTTDVNVENVNIGDGGENEGETTPPVQPEPPIEPDPPANPPQSPLIAFQGYGGDNVYNAGEIGLDSSVELLVTLKEDAQVGDVLIVKDGGLSTVYSNAVTQAMLDSGVTISIPLQLTDSSVTASSSIVSAQGVASDSVSVVASVDAIPPKNPTVQFLGAGGDDVYDSSEIGGDGTVSALITLDAETDVSDVLTVFDKSGAEVFKGSVTSSMLSGGHVVELPVALGDANVKTSAYVSDLAGNLSATIDDIKLVNNIAPPPQPFNLTGIAAKDTNTLSFSWDGNATGITYKVCLKDTNLPDSCDEKSSALGVNSVDVSGLNIFDALSESFFVLSENSSGKTSSSELTIDKTVVDSLIEYVKSSDVDSLDNFGYSVSLSHNGDILAVGAYGEGSISSGVNGDGSDNSAGNSGAVYVFRNNGGNWVQEAYLKASNSQSGDYFGWDVSLSGDGNTLAVGAYREDSGSFGVNGDQSDNSASLAGAVYVFRYDNLNWTQEAYLKASNASGAYRFGSTVGLNSDGNVLAVGSQYENSGASGVNGDQADSSMSQSGAVYVFRRDGLTWAQEAYLKASNTDAADEFGYSLALNGDGGVLVVGAPKEDSVAVGLGGDQLDNSKRDSGAVYIFRYDNLNWTQEAYLKSSNSGLGDLFGLDVALSDDGSTLAISATKEDSFAVGVGGDQLDNSLRDSGAVYMFRHDGLTWSQQAYLKAANTGAGDSFGRSLSLSSDGLTLAVGANDEASSSVGLNGEQLDDSATSSGAAYLFYDNEGIWVQGVYIKSTNSDGDDFFGRYLALSGNGHTLAVGANGEDSVSSGINGGQLDNSLSSSGSVYIYD